MVPTDYIAELAADAASAAESALPMVRDWGLAVVVGMVFVEFIVGVGYLAQANTTLIAAGMLYGDSNSWIFACVIGAAVAAIGGSLLSRTIGRAGSRMAGGHLSRSTQYRIAGALQRHTGLIAFAFHFSAWLRPAVPAVAGASDVDEKRWFPWDAAGAFMWASVLVVLGARVKEMLYRSVHVLDVVLVVLLVSIVGGAAVYTRGLLGVETGGTRGGGSAGGDGPGEERS